MAHRLTPIGELVWDIPYRPANLVAHLYLVGLRAQRIANGGWIFGHFWSAQPRQEGLSAAQVELTVTSVPAEVKQEYTTYGVPLLKTPSYCTRLAAKLQFQRLLLPTSADSADVGHRMSIIRVRKGEQFPDEKKTSQTAKFTAEKWSGAILSSSETTARKGDTARATSEASANYQGLQGEPVSSEVPLWPQ